MYIRERQKSITFYCECGKIKQLENTMTYVFARSSNCRREHSRIIGYYWRPEAASRASDESIDARARAGAGEMSGVRAI